MNKITSGISCLVLALLISGCSRKKDTFINRNWHAVTTEYNTLYNGEVAFEEGRQQIVTSYNENFWDILPVERMQISQEIKLQGESKNENFKRAEEKATKAIQKHSMLINGKEQNPQIDEAYLLLGKARYFDQRFIPALEAFNYILYKYPASNTIHHAQIWREKTNIRLQNNKLAIKNLKKIIGQERISDEDLTDANAMLAQAFINTGMLDSALVPIRNAAKYAENSDQKGRYLYIQGQLYNRLNKRDSANLAFEKIIDLNRKTPRAYLINAHLQQAANFNFSQNDPQILLARLQELEANRENNPFLDKIYFRLAEYYTHLDSTTIAANYYNKSLKASTSDNYLQSLNYETLGNINFDNANYRVASAYYDSTLTKLPTNSRDYFFIQRKKDNLKEVILYEEIAERNDSILRFVSMNDDERLSYFSTYTNKLKESAIAEAKKGVNAETAPATGLRATQGMPPAIGGASPGNVFYFYNSVRVASGMQQFLRNWGPRELQDNWRLQSGNITSGIREDLDEVSNLIIENNPDFDPQTYLSQIPSEPKIIDSLTIQRNDAYFKLGLIYKEKFQEYSLATERLKAVLEFTDEDRLKVPSLFHLYQISLAENNLTEAENYKQQILNNYADSRYASAIKNPGTSLGIKDQAVAKYEELYRFFEKGEYQKVIDLSSAYKKEFQGDDIIPKMELLNAQAIGRLKGLIAYRESLNYVVANYPQSEEGKKALSLVNDLLPGLENEQFNLAPGQVNFKLVYQFKNDEQEKASALKEKIEKALTELEYTQLSVSKDVYNEEGLFVVVHGLDNEQRAEGFAELLKINKKYNVELEPLMISSANYRILQLQKNLETYNALKNKS